jgi:hypothetical protein
MRRYLPFALPFGAAAALAGAAAAFGAAFAPGLGAAAAGFFAAAMVNAPSFSLSTIHRKPDSFYFNNCTAALSTANCEKQAI